MQTITYSQFGAPDVAGIAQRDVPSIGPLDVLVRVEAASVSAADAAARQGSDIAARLYFGIRSPRFPVLGSDIAGTVAEIGRDVTQFAVGDLVVGAVGATMGAHAQFVRMPEGGSLVHRPESISAVDILGTTEGGLTALHFVRDVAAIGAGHNVLVIGASGSVGASAVQLARHYGATVTAVCSAKNAALVRSLGAEHVIDYSQTDFTTNGLTYDVIFDAVAKRSYHSTVRSLAPRGLYMSTVPTLSILVPALATKWSKGKRARIAFAGLRKPQEMRADLAELVQLASDGDLVPVLGGVFTFEQAPEAYAVVDSGHKTGTVVVVP